ncbi:alanine racemase [Azorhizobium oxalatiphilum]|uniref:Alanine racemase n=1 Tax=Azorhizobium oxalatiphilum TaxID=980631 RepID=A0A917CAM4_9HYPH|nr:alanine racemase [Azorhizobium oxalatiphilum]GGF78268.1 alanine racemase [Azorhizobium oxalatiphilum]
MYVDVSEPQAAETAPGLLTINLSALARNYRALAARLAPTAAGAVVKADAYGLGATRVAPALHAAGCRTFFVAHLGEALKLRRLIPDDSRLFVLNGLLPGAEALCADADIIPVLNSLEQVANWAAAAQAQGRSLPAALQFDTGMSRLGLSDDEAQALVDDPSLLRGIDIAFVMSHLASADEPDSPQNAAQLAAMRRFAAAYPGLDICFSNSGGIFLDAGYHVALARPGIALYGGAPTGGIGNPMEPVVRLDVRVTQTRTVPAGARVGYGGTYVTKGETRLATVAAGYADGLPRHLSDRGAAYFGGTRLPIVGRVSMDAMTLDISALPEGALKLGSLVEIIGPHQSLEDVAAAAGTIAYEILTSLGQRYHRAYR